MFSMAFEWIRTDEIDFNMAARIEGFNLGMYEDYPKEVQETIKSRTINRIIKTLDYEWENKVYCHPNKNRFSSKFSDVKRGIYVLSLSSGFAIEYPKGVSNVIYIGKGSSRGRIKSHLKTSLFDLYRSLNGINFRFHFSEPKKQKSPQYYEDVETDLLNEFREIYGDDDELRYPILNYNSGRQHNKAHDHGKNWKAPLKNSGSKFNWEIRPTRKSGWPKKLRDG